MSKAPTFAIPVRAHVKQFLLKEFGPEPIAIHQNTLLGRLVRMKAEKQPYRQLRPRESSEGPALSISLPTSMKHSTLTTDSLRQMGELLDKDFQLHLIMFVKGQLVVTQNERGAIRSFYKLYDINPDDYDIEEARKVVRDYKDRVLRANGQLGQVYDADQAAELFNDYAVREAA